MGMIRCQPTIQIGDRLQSDASHNILFRTGSQGRFRAQLVTLLMSQRPLKVGIHVPPILSPRGQIKAARFLEALGFQHLWNADHMLVPEGAPCYDPWTLMGPMAMNTKKVTLGPGVTDPHRHHPAVLAQRLATLDQLSKGRVVLGFGSGEAMNLEPYGIPWQERRVRKVSEFITVLRGLLESRNPFTFEGDFYQLKRARLAVRPYKNRRIPIYMAALGPMMQKLAGKKADGWLPTVIPPEYFAEYFEPMAEAARKAGRDPSRMPKVANVVAAMDTDGSTSANEIMELLRPLAGTLLWQPVMERMGHSFAPPDEARCTYLDVNPCDPESLLSYWKMQQWIPDETLLDIVTYGGSEEIVEECRRFAEAGATEIVLVLAAIDPIGALIRVAREVLPRVTGRPPTPLARVLSSTLGPLIRRGITKRRFPTPVDVSLNELPKMFAD